ncbi:hydrolase [Pendulispora rubella]|uniref:Hydrolase n=1 Tax=Pendulispora rubella TaxID=2741070 RepID=A0ABZ2KXL2_9BACT
MNDPSQTSSFREEILSMSLLQLTPLKDIAAVAQVAARHASEGELHRRLHPEVARALTEFGFARRFVPERFGGEPVSYAQLTADVAVAGAGCASAAWVASLLAYSGRFATFLPERGQEEVWAGGPDVRFVAAMIPQGRAVRVDGGFRLSGTWHYVSGVDYADWALVLGPAAENAPSRFMAVRREDFTVEDTWHTLGMRGTGSHSITLTDVFVPEHRTLPQADLFAGNRGGVHGAPPLFAVNGLTFAAPLLGAARGAARLAAATLGDAPGRPPAKESYRIAYTRATAEVDAAGLLLARVAESVDEGPVTPELVARSRRDAAYATQLLVDAVDRLFEGNGVRSQAQSNPLQRFWRDVRGGATHGVLQFEAAALEFTKGPGG